MRYNDMIGGSNTRCRRTPINAAAVALAVLLVLLAGLRPSAAAGSGPATVVVLNRGGQPAAALTDGDEVRLRLALFEPARSPLEVAFRLEGQETVVGTCRVAAGAAGCETQPLLSLGWHWDQDGAARWQRVVQAWAGGALRAASQPIQVAPRPVVMVHGFNSNWQTWTTYLGPDGYLAGIGVPGFAVGDGQVAGAMNTGSVTNPTVRTNTIHENATILGEYIAAVKRKTGAQQVDLVAHSMGGLISRYYIDRVMDGRDVGQFITLGTPNAGTDCANLPGALGMLHPATLEIRPSYVNGIFNPQITRLRGVPYHAVAGTSVESAVGAPCTQTPTDLLVSLESAGALPVTVTEVAFLHHELNKSPEVFEQAVKPLLQAPAGSFTAPPDPVLPVAQSEPLQFTRIYTGHVPAGGSATHTIPLEPGIALASFGLFDQTRSLTVTVRGASGNVITLNRDTNGVVLVDDPDTLLYLGYGFANPNPGVWEVTLSATGDTPADGARYAVTAQLVGGAVLHAQVGELLPPLAAPVRLTGRLDLEGQGITLQSVQAVIRDPEGGAVTVDLPAAGSEWDGSWTPRLAGLHAVDITAAGQLPDGTAVERSAFLAFEVQPRPNLLPTYLLLGGLCVLGLVVLAGFALAARGVWRRARRPAG